jgi:hypothetical protein
LIVGTILISCDNNCEIVFKKEINFEPNGGCEVLSITHSSYLPKIMSENHLRDGYS